MLSSIRARWLAATILIGAFAPGCGSSTTAPSPLTPPAVRPNVTITSVNAAGAGRTGSYQYHTTLRLNETAGANATIAAVDLAFMNGSTTLVVSHHDQPISDGTNVCPASGTIATRELVTTDTEPSHAFASTVRATVTFGDGSGFSATATGTANVPPLAPSDQTYSLTGVITDAVTHAPIAGARLDVINGSNAGKTATADSTGTYVMTDLVAETFRLRASASDHSSGEQNVTIPTNPRADFSLAPIVQPPCTYTVSPTGPAGVSYEGGTFIVTVSRASGTCSWQAVSDVSWITLPDHSSGNGSAVLSYDVVPNPTFNSRTGHITVSWSGGSAQVTVQQGNHPDWTCNPFAMSKGPQDFDNVPATGGTLTVNASATANPPEWSSMCAVSVASTASWISGGGTVIGPTGLTFIVAPNPSPGTARTGAIVGGSISISVTQR